MDIQAGEPLFTFYADEHDHVQFECPACGKRKETDVSAYRDKGLDVKIRCGCGHDFRAHVEFRKFHRKRVELPATATLLGSPASLELVVTDLSLAGAGVKLIPPAELHEGEEIEIRFHLDSPMRPLIVRKARVTRVRDDFAHLRFVNAPLRDADLGFYLMP